MKLALVFCIIGGIISCSLQQGRPFRVGWFPNSYQGARLPLYYFVDQDADITEMDPRVYDLPANEVQERPASLSPFFKSSKNHKNPQSRFFGFMLYNQLKNSLLFPSVSTVTFTSTSTSLITAVSTITTVSLQKCISLNNFVSGSTAECPGKKRSIEWDPIEPSKVLPIESSRIPRNHNNGQDSESYVVSSSLSDDLQESDVVSPRQFVGGLFPSYSKLFPNVPTSVQVVMVTSTTTSFSLVASVVKKPVAVATVITVPGPALANGSPGPLVTYGGIMCLPPGFIVC